ncbi:MAG: hypothetical protein ACI9DC_004346 [Gammaproteobacteria bacterium]
MSAIAEIRSRLKKYPNARYNETSTSIEVLPENENGFAVGFYEKTELITVYFDGWHETFKLRTEALNN